MYFVLLIWVNLAMYFVSLHKQKQPLEDLTLLECGSEIKKNKKNKLHGSWPDVKQPPQPNKHVTSLTKKFTLYTDLTQV